MAADLDRRDPRTCDPMDMIDDVLSLERRFWLEGADFYREHLAGECVMLLPGAGMMGRREVIEAITGGQRWTQVEMREERSLELGPDCRLVCYEARARREGAEEYSALVSSIYVRSAGVWQLIFHQQSPTA